MGWSFCKNNINKKKINEILLESHRNLLLDHNNTNFDINIYDNNIRAYQIEFYKNINNEINLMNYLDSIKNTKNIIFKEYYDLELFLYFDVLCAKNKIKHSGVHNFTSSYSIFIELINLLNDVQFEEIKIK